VLFAFSPKQQQARSKSIKNSETKTTKLITCHNDVASSLNNKEKIQDKREREKKYF
jgi:hypothetical protein